MKKIAVFTVLAMVLIASCAAQSPANDAQRVVGTWVAEAGWENSTWVFNANGTGTISEGGETLNIFWGVSSTGMISVHFREHGRGWNYVFSLSPDGRIMLIGEDMVLQRR